MCRPHTPTNTGGDPLSYDANGNMTVGLAGRVIAYDYANRPTSVQVAGQTTAYTYGPDGARQTKAVGASETFYAGMAEIRNFGGAGESLILQPHPEDSRQTDLIKEAWEDSGKVYGYRKLHDDLCDLGETCCPNRVARLAQLAGIRAQIGYKRRPGKYGGKPSVVVDNTLSRQFDVDAPDLFWVTDITYIKTYEGYSYLAVIIDLYSRKIVGWAMQSRQPTDLVLQALMMAVWRRKPTNKVLVHSDQGSQFTSREWSSFLKHHNLEHSMSRRGNCHDNAVAESFFNLLKRERIRRRTYKTREEARRDVFDYIEMFYNPKRKHARNGMLSPVEFEKQQKWKQQGV